MVWQWHQLHHMQIICTLLQTDNRASTSPLSFLHARCSSCRPINSVKALKAKALFMYWCVICNVENWQEMALRGVAPSKVMIAATSHLTSTRLRISALSWWNLKPLLYQTRCHRNQVAAHVWVDLLHNIQCKIPMIMAALRSRCGHYVFVLFLSSSSLLVFSSPNLSGHRLDVYHTCTHGVALVQI